MSKPKSVKVRIAVAVNEFGDVWTEDFANWSNEDVALDRCRRKVAKRDFSGEKATAVDAFFAEFDAPVPMPVEPTIVHAKVTKVKEAKR